MEDAASIRTGVAHTLERAPQYRAKGTQRGVVELRVVIMRIVVRDDNRMSRRLITNR